MKYPQNTDIYHYDFEPFDQRLKKDEKREFWRKWSSVSVIAICIVYLPPV